MALSKKILLYYVATFVVFSVLSVLATLYPIEVSVFTHVLFPIAAMLNFGMLTRFGYMKLNTLIVGRVLIILGAMGWWNQNMHTICLILLQFNILEAIVLDLIKKHYYNALSGILLLASSFHLVLHWTGSYALIKNESYFLWISVYTIWNANFAALQLSGYFYIHHFIILLTPIVCCLLFYDFSYWMVFRETSLLLGITSLTCFKKERYRLEDRSPYKNWMHSIQLFVQNQRNQLILLLVLSFSIFVQIVFIF